MYHSTRYNAVRERIIAGEVMKLQRRQARERAADPKSQRGDAGDLGDELAQRRT